MNLNLQLIESELPGFDFEEYLVDGPAVLNGAYPLLYETGSPFGTSPIYIAGVGDLPPVPTLTGARASLICIGTPSDSYRGQSFNTLVIKNDVNPRRVLALVTEVFHRYYEFELAMQHVIDERQDLEAMFAIYSGM